MVILDLISMARKDLPVGDHLREALDPLAEYQIHDMALAPDRRRLAIALSAPDPAGVSVDLVCCLDLERTACL